ncbi:MAG: alanine racemase [Alphaproteobacteria bacterium]|nr:alanine racemase [Alphaproteobacteria bacterium SS10]
MSPRVQISQAILDRNIADMQAIADSAGVRLRPHAKTHKSVEIARRQMAAGAVGLTVAKPAEAIVFLEAGIPSIKLCYPVIEEEPLDAVLAAAKKHQAEVIFVVDSDQGIDALMKVSAAHGVELPVYVEVDVGLRRCGVAPSSLALVELAGRVAAAPSLTFVGLTAHAGHAYGVTGADQAAGVAEAERQAMLKAKARLEALGMPVPEICVGSTPSLWAQQDFTGITEIKPGNYVLNDLTQLTIGVVDWERLALSVAATVVSANDTYLIIDAGSKVLTSDLGPHGNQSISGHGQAYTADQQPGRDTGLTVTKLSEEHGWIAHEGNPLPIGTRLTVFPNHACPVVNLVDRLAIEADGDIAEHWTVDARGCF